MTTDYQQTFYAIAKRFVDIAAGIVGILVFGIPMVIIAIAIRMDSEGAAFFKQERVGEGGKAFWMYKFRSMVKDAEEIIKQWEREDPELWERYKAGNFKLKDDPRITRVGRFIRRGSLDELPQFFNVLKGEMSLVGPRAYKPDELEDYVREHPEAKGDVELILTIKPGITGLWQVSGRSKTSFTKRIEIDVSYAGCKSLLKDIKIIFRTPAAVLKKDGAY